VQELYSISDSRLHLLDIDSGKLERIRIGDGVSSDILARFDREDRQVLAVSNALGEFSSVVRVDLATGVVAPLFPQQQWDVEDIDVSPDGRYLAVMRNIDGSSDIGVYDQADSMKQVRSLKFDQGVARSPRFNHAGTEIGFDISGPQIPGDVFSRTLNSGLMTRWTRGETGGIDPNTFITPRTIRFGSFDNDKAMMNLPRQIPAYVYEPLGSGPFPVLVMIHGGPEAQARPQFSELIQFLVRERGIAVVVPNVRGSAGYGKTYLALDNGRLREDSVKDIGALIGYLGTQPQFDPQRIAVYGGSYGGYMVLASMVHFSDQLRAGVDIVGISNFVTFLENTNPYRVDLRRPEYGDERDPDMREFLLSISPLTHVDRIRAPLFVIQGANDPRVPRSEAEQILKAVRANGREAWFMLATDEGHGFRKKANRDRMNEAVIQFLDMHLLPATP
jgi:dipeptidyl aminopeptidase/acylaminoacyl peptidase